MKLTFVEQLPPVRKFRSNHKIQALLKSFANSDHKIARVDFTDKDYACYNACLNSLRVGVIKSNRPVQVVQRGNQIYLVKKYL